MQLRFIKRFLYKERKREGRKKGRKGGGGMLAVIINKLKPIQVV